MPLGGHLKVRGGPPAVTGRVPEAGAVGERHVGARDRGLPERRGELVHARPELGEVGLAKGAFRRGAHARPRHVLRIAEQETFSWTAGRNPASSKSANQRSGGMNG